MSLFNTQAIYLFVGRQKAGKGNMCAYILEQMISKKILGYGKAFLTTVDDNFDFLDRKHVYVGMDEDKIQEFLEECLTKRAAGEQYWLLFDDGIGRFNFYSDVFKHLGAASRNYNLTLFFLNQQYAKIAPIIRTNSSYIFVFRFDNKFHAEEIYNENGCFANKQDFMKYYEECTSVDKQCMFIDKTHSDGLHVEPFKVIKFKVTRKYVFVNKI